MAGKWVEIERNQSTKCLASFYSLHKRLALLNGMTASKDKYFPMGDLVVTGEAEAVVQIPQSNVAGYKVNLDEVLPNGAGRRVIYVRLPSLTQSNSFWHPYKIKIPPPPFKALFVLNGQDGDVYTTSWIAPEDSFTWPPSPGILHFIEAAAIKSR